MRKARRQIQHQTGASFLGMGVVVLSVISFLAILSIIIVITRALLG